EVLVVSLCKPILEPNVLSLEVTEVEELFTERSNRWPWMVGKDTDSYNLRRLLRQHGWRVNECCCAYDGDKCASRNHSITSSARASSDGDTVRPSAFAVLRLTRSLASRACSIGSSPGASPFRMRSTYHAERLARGTKLKP